MAESKLGFSETEMLLIVVLNKALAQLPGKSYRRLKHADFRALPPYHSAEEHDLLMPTPTSARQKKAAVVKGEDSGDGVYRGNDWFSRPFTLKGKALFRVPGAGRKPLEVDVRAYLRIVEWKALGDVQGMVDVVLWSGQDVATSWLYDLYDGHLQQEEPEVWPLKP